MTRRKRIALIVLVALLFAGASAWLNREWVIARLYIGTLESQERVRDLQIDRVIGVLGVKPGERVADLGAGTGVFTRRWAQAVGPGGVVYAVDVNRELLEHIDETARKQGLGNVHTVLAGEDDPLIPEPVDLIFICDTFHHIGNRAEYLRNLRRYLRPSGRVAIIDFIRSPHLRLFMKFSLQELDKWFQDAGYRSAGSYDFLEDQFFVVYSADGSAFRGPASVPKLTLHAASSGINP